MRILENTNYDFIGQRKKAYIASSVFILIGIISMFWHGFEVGIDFKGGTEIVVASSTELNVGEVRAVLASAFESEPEVKRFGSDILIRLVDIADAEAAREQVINTLAAEFPGSNPTVVGGGTIAPRFASDLIKAAIYATLGSLLVIFVYVLIRFEWRFGVGSLVSLFHDVLVALSLFSLLHGIVPFSLQIDQTIIAALLTIVGYSINDTVVVFDRIREQMGIQKGASFEQLANDAINQTLSRTIVTGGSTLLVVLVLFIFGGATLKGFAFALLIGIGVGIYSSVFIASAVAVDLRNLEKPAPVLATKR